MATPVAKVGHIDHDLDADEPEGDRRPDRELVGQAAVQQEQDRPEHHYEDEGMEQAHPS